MLRHWNGHGFILNSLQNLLYDLVNFCGVVKAFVSQAPADVLSVIEPAYRHIFEKQKIAWNLCDSSTGKANDKQ